MSDQQPCSRSNKWIIVIAALVVIAVFIADAARSNELSSTVADSSQATQSTKATSSGNPAIINWLLMFVLVILPLWRITTWRIRKDLKPRINRHID